MFRLLTRQSAPAPVFGIPTPLFFPINTTLALAREPSRSLGTDAVTPTEAADSV
jgi:hypothetical protein